LFFECLIDGGWVGLLWRVGGMLGRNAVDWLVSFFISLHSVQVLILIFDLFLISGAHSVDEQNRG